MVNLLFDLVICLVGILLYRKGRNVLAVWVVVAFGLFAVSYFLTILGMGSSAFLIPLRLCGYLSVLVGLILSYRR